MKARKASAKTALAVKPQGRVLRGGAFKPDFTLHFRALVKKLEILAKAREVSGLAIVTEVMSPSDVQLVEEFADILQVGTKHAKFQPFACCRQI